MSSFQILVGLVGAGEVFLVGVIEQWLNRKGLTKLKILVLGFVGFRALMFGLGVADGIVRKSAANMIVPMIILSLWIMLIIGIVERDASKRAQTRQR